VLSVYNGDPESSDALKCFEVCRVIHRKFVFVCIDQCLIYQDKAMREA